MLLGVQIVDTGATWRVDGKKRSFPPAKEFSLRRRPHYLNACRAGKVQLSALYRNWLDNCDHKRKVINESLPKIDRALTKRVKYS